MLEIKEHRFIDAKQVNSPNFNDRPVGCEPELVVIHSISLPPGQFGGPHIEELFTNCLNPNQHPYFAEICGLEVSSHLFIDRKGELVQFVPLNKRAWHAGKSQYQGRDNCNDFSIGIELEGTDTGDYTQAQYASLVNVLNALFNSYPELTPDRLTGHEHIAPGRKTDPGPGFDWSQLQNMLQRIQGSES